MGLRSMGFVIGITAACLIRCIPVANAAGLDLCNDVLQQDIFNRTFGGSQASESERQAYLDSFFSSDVDKAYEEYKSARAEQHQASTSVKAEGHYGIIGGEFDLSTEHGGARVRRISPSSSANTKQCGKANPADRRPATAV